jgi:hypothetical protein
MKKSFLTICFCIAFVSIGWAQDAGPKSEKKKRMSRRAVNVAALNVTALKLTYTEISSTCPEEARECGTDRKIPVATTAVYSETMKYVYTVTAGKILGSGANVVWDLSNVKPGTYTITAAIDEGSPWGILGQTKTKTVRIIDCAECESEEGKDQDN